VLAAPTNGRYASEQQLVPLARRARLARTNAEATVARSLSEPQTTRIDAEESQAGLGALRRLSQAAHVLRLEAEEARPPSPSPALASLATDIDRLLAVVEANWRGAPGPGASTLPDLRASYLAFEHSGLADDLEHAVLLAELDEIVDAANGLAAIVGIDAIDKPETPPRRRHSSTTWFLRH
jgi:hypothetical protein